MASAHWHSSVSPELRELCDAACAHAPRQLDALRLKSHDYSTALIARVLAITEQAARRLIDRATANVQREQMRRERV